MGVQHVYVHSSIGKQLISCPLNLKPPTFSIDLFIKSCRFAAFFLGLVHLTTKKTLVLLVFPVPLPAAQPLRSFSRRLDPAVAPDVKQPSAATAPEDAKEGAPNGPRETRWFDLFVFLKDFSGVFGIFFVCSFLCLRLFFNGSLVFVLFFFLCFKEVVFRMF